jgi:predicted dehydrogenase
VERLNIGIVGGAGRRGPSLKRLADATGLVHILAICDTNEEALQAAGKSLGPVKLYSDYHEMLEDADMDAVIISTPMHLHASMAISALKKHIHVLSEVTAGVSIEECRKLVKACKESKGIYMMAENYVYMKPNVLIRELVAKGLFGQVYYAEGEYLHAIKPLYDTTPWRRRWQAGINGITYGTHSLGPILQWMPGDRISQVACVGSGHHYIDSGGRAYEQEDTCVMLAKTEKGSLIKIRVDIISDRPHAATNYSLQGTGGCYESARSQNEKGKIWLADLCKDPNEWMDLEDLEDAYLPRQWKYPSEAMKKAGHGGGDYFVFTDFINSIINGATPPIGIHQAMDMTLPGLASQESIKSGGIWLDVPDSRTW